MNQIINISYIDDMEFYLDAVKLLLEQKVVAYKGNKISFQVNQYLNAKSFMDDNNQNPDIIMLDILFKSDKKIGHDLAVYSKQKYPDAVLIMYSQLNDDSTVKEFISIGANYYISKNTSVQNLSISLLQCYYSYKKDIIFSEVKDEEHFQEIESKIKKLITSEVINTVHIYGEPGTGKEQIIDVFKTNIKNNKLVRINCALTKKEEIVNVLSESLHKAHKGWLLIDEIDFMRLEAQALLLKYLDTGRLDSNEIKIKIVTVTNKNLKEYVDNNIFNNELLQRISLFSIYVPPLRKRKDEISKLTNSIIDHITYGNKKYQVTPGALKLLNEYDWKLGNIRELKNCILSMLANCKNNTLDEHTVPKYIIHSINDNHNNLSEIVINIDLNKDSYREVEDNLFVSFITKIIKEKSVKSLRGIVPYTDFKRSTLIHKIDGLPPEKKKQIQNLLKKNR